MEVLKSNYWDNWFQKLGSFLVSVKMIIITASFGLSSVFYVACEQLLKGGKLNGDQFVKLMEADLKYLSVILGAVLATRGAIQVADVIKKKTLNKIKEKAKELEK